MSLEVPIQVYPYNFHKSNFHLVQLQLDVLILWQQFAFRVVLNPYNDDDLVTQDQIHSTNPNDATLQELHLYLKIPKNKQNYVNQSNVDALLQYNQHVEIQCVEELDDLHMLIYNLFHLHLLHHLQSFFY